MFIFHTYCFAETYVCITFAGTERSTFPLFQKGTAAMVYATVSHALRDVESGWNVNVMLWNLSVGNVVWKGSIGN